MLYKSITLMFFFGCILSMNAQVISPRVTALAGASAQNGGISLDWTLGEGSITTLTSGSLTLTQGFHQPNLFDNVAVEDYNSSIDVRLYPNPVVESLMLKSKEDNLSFEVFDLSGQLIQKDTKFQYDTSIDFTGMIPNIYFIHVKKEGNPIKIFKIEKVH